MVQSLHLPWDTYPELSTRPGEVIKSYATNTVGTLAPLFTPEGFDLYRPGFFRMQLEPVHPSPNAAGDWRLYR